MIIEDPDGSTASYDAERTRLAYSEISADDCSCDGCRNYRAAWKPDYFDPDLLTACSKIGVDPAKAFETTALYSKSGLLGYTGQLPFFGEVIHRPPPTDRSYSSWGFSEAAYGSARFASGLAAIDFSVELPWVLAEANTYPEE